MKRVVKSGRKENKSVLSGIIGRIKKPKTTIFKAPFGKIMYSALILALSVVSVTQIASAGKISYRAANTQVTDWGLYYPSENAIPRGNADSDYLKNYDAFFMGNEAEKTVYLTFDGGYEAGYTDKILDTLAEYNVKAAFFLVGHYFESSPATAQRMAAEGHLICNHTYSHPDATVLDEKAFNNELEKLNAVCLETTGSPVAKFYRPPAGKFNSATLAAAQSCGYTTVFWSVAYADWDENNQPAPSSALDTLNSRVHNGAIILLHITSKTNSEILSAFIEGLLSQGYTFASLTELK